MSEELKQEVIMPEAPKSVDISAAVSKEVSKKLADVCYEHGKYTVKKDSKTDIFVTICGLFALGCLGVSIYFVIKITFDWVFALLMAIYLLVAATCLIKPLYILYRKAGWKSGFKKRLPAQKFEKPVHFDETSLSFSGKEDRIVYYDSMVDGYETEDCYVFHCSDLCIIPVAKTAVTEAAKSSEIADLHEFFKTQLTKANGTAPEEPVPQITR